MSRTKAPTRSSSGIVSDRPVDAQRPLKIIYIGAGISGIIAAIYFRKFVPSAELVIYEKNPEIGGTWYENRYPGCACDIPSHSYQLSFESWTHWSSFYAGAPEILDYWKRVADKYDVRKHVRFGHKCIGAWWDEACTKWRVKLSTESTEEKNCIIEDSAEVLMTGTGLLNEWKWPSIPGLNEFKGDLLHTANWDKSFDAEGKVVAVIGAGSSGIQVVPTLAPQVKGMHHYIRGKTWISNQLSADLVRERATDGGATNFEYTADEQSLWRSDRDAYLEYRKSLEFRLQGNYAVSQRGHKRHASAREQYETNMRSRLAAKPEIADLLIPDFPPLCKRLTPGPGYLEALASPAVDVITQPISHVDESSVITSDGVHRSVDAIICATGFETSLGHGFPIIGRQGVNLRKKYADRPQTYLGLCTDGFPNFFQSLGPNSFQGAGSLLVMMEAIHHYVAQILVRLATGNVKTIEPKQNQVKNFTDYCDEYFERTVYTTDCASWYKAAPAGATPEEQRRARVTALWPGSSLHAVKTMQSVRWDDFDMELLDDNDFAWFGNGCTVADENPSEDNIEQLTWYLNGTRFLDGEAM